MSLSHHENHGSRGEEKVYDKVRWYSSLVGMLIKMGEGEMKSMRNVNDGYTELS
jgi:hypothetical protein